MGSFHFAEYKFHIGLNNRSISMRPKKCSSWQFNHNEVILDIDSQLEEIMLSAILNGKKCGTGLAGKSLQIGTAKGAEDIITSTVFERVAYLPDSVFVSFFDHLLSEDGSVGTLEECDFWPRWPLGSGFIQPDVVLYCSKRTILVEAKRYDNIIQQNAEQLAEQLKSGIANEFLGENPIILTIGGLSDYNNLTSSSLSTDISSLFGADKSNRYELFCRSWSQIYISLQSAILCQSEDSADGFQGLKRLLNDVACTYEWHGLRTHKYLGLSELLPANIKYTKVSICNINDSAKKI